MNRHLPLPPGARLGVDIGRVIIGATADDGTTDTSFLSGSEDDALRTPPVPGAFETIARLHAHLEGRVWLVSKCGPRIQALTRRWLAHQGFHDVTGIPPEHVRFCRERRQKREHALALGLTCFVDDRLDVLRHLEGVVPALCWFGVQRDPAPDWVVATRTWRDVQRVLLGDPEVLGGHVVDEPHA
ncbi:hypothetical protein [Sandaracinus amylolyticus]|uniref:hypothetical protein n=1 Tax=Sandaracinus amylolyticus TaxID=927083 RepID=UPI00069CF655|nr:hypothetical protein [Sandaracinus amylolyticus]